MLISFVNELLWRNSCVEKLCKNNNVGLDGINLTPLPPK